MSHSALLIELHHALAWADQETRELHACAFPKKEAKARRATEAIRAAITALSDSDAAVVSAQHGASDNSEQDQPEPGRAAIAKGERQPVSSHSMSTVSKGGSHE